jgi:hypothetical protein
MVFLKMECCLNSNYKRISRRNLSVRVGLNLAAQTVALSTASMNGAGTQWKLITREQRPSAPSSSCCPMICGAQIRFAMCRAGPEIMMTGVSLNQFLDQLIEDVKASGMTGPDVQWDIWNEPDLLTPVIFWGRSQDQYLEMWKRAFLQIRAAIPEAVIVGPSTAGQPSPGRNGLPGILMILKETRSFPII